MMRKFFLALPLVLLAGTAQAAVTAGKAERTAPDKVMVAWTGKAPVDVYVSDRADATIAQAKLVSEGDRDGRFEMTTEATARPYFILREKGDAATVRVAERVLPLQQGSNFRDLGGYPAADGKHVRWGLIYRSGGQPMLNDIDLKTVGRLGLMDLIDLRTSEERVIAPTRINGVRYTAVGYTVAQMSAGLDMGAGGAMNMDRVGQIYRAFPTLLKPQLKALFSTLLADQGPVAYNCSAGQDRTGLATALILTALGVPRETILADYHLSTTWRRPQWEMPRLDAAAHPNDPGVAYFASFQKDPKKTVAPLFDSQQRPLLQFAFEEIEAKWGSVDAYLDKELGVGPDQIARLRAEYLE